MEVHADPEAVSCAECHLPRPEMMPALPKADELMRVKRAITGSDEPATQQMHKNGFMILLNTCMYVSTPANGIKTDHLMNLHQYHLTCEVPLARLCKWNPMQPSD